MEREDAKSPETVMLGLAVFRAVMPSEAASDDDPSCDTDSLVPVRKPSSPQDRSSAIALPEPNE